MNSSPNQDVLWRDPAIIVPCASNSTRESSEEQAKIVAKLRTYNTEHASLTSIEETMLEHAGNTIEDTTEVGNLLINQAHAARHLLELISNRSIVLCFVSCSNDNSTNAELYDIVSKLFHKAFRTVNSGDKVTNHALCDVF